MQQLAQTRAMSPFTIRSAGYTLAALFVLNMMNYVDRLLFGVTQELIRADLGLSDFQLGLLGGPAFALLYVLFSFPIARVAERGNRVSIISIAFAAWSALTACCGLAASFVQLLLARAGVSVGEAGCAPPSHSLISDYFPPERRTSAMSVYGAAGPVGALVAAVGGGWIAQHFGWRVTFLACGGFGVAAAILFRLTMREPARQAVAHQPSMAGALGMLLGKRSFVLVAAAGAVAGFASYSNHQYMVSFLMRAHGLSVGTAGTVLGLVIGGVGILVTLAAGPIIDGNRVRFPGIRTWLPAVGLLWSGLFFATAFTIRDTALSIGLLVTASIGQHFYMPSMYTVAQDVAPPAVRATAAALLIAIISVVGYGLGPPLVGLASDVLGGLAMTAHGTSAAACKVAASAACEAAKSDGLRLSLSIGSIGFVIAGILFALAGRTIDRDVHR
ncbi:spinster family MFS transporter [Sphingomonas sp. KC8]|uniref:spinster family MFS transporter n=1 Tax=Sphingomonas sp. KC8 TaxID=1030157 RepID=UPI000248A78C|nr:MFS transporter [Sphingomonas sp. KC8]ARS26875.1 MFS transporter [Sphingomonas sp. KC8]